MCVAVVDVVTLYFAPDLFS